MNEKLPIFIFLVSMIGVLTYDLVDYYDFKKLESYGEITKVFSQYNKRVDNYDWFFKTNKGEIINVLESYNNKKYPNVERFFSTAKVIYNPDNPEKYAYYPFHFSWVSVIKRVFFIGIFITLLNSLVTRVIVFFKKGHEKFDNWQKYENQNGRFKEFKWVIKEHPIFNFFTLNQLLVLFYPFGFCITLISFGVSYGNLISIVIMFSFLLKVINSFFKDLKFVLINESKIEIHFWLFPPKRKIINIENIRKVNLIRKFGESAKISYSLEKEEKEKNLLLPFSDKKVTDLYYIIKELKNKYDAQVA